MKKIVVACVAAITIVICGAYLNVGQNYMYGPFSEMNEDVTFYEWSHFKKPLKMEISHIDLNWKTKTINDYTAMRRIMTALMESEYSSGATAQEGRHFVITISRPKNYDDEIVLQFNGYDNGYIHINNGKTVRMTEELQGTIHEILNDLERQD